MSATQAQMRVVTEAERRSRRQIDPLPGRVRLHAREATARRQDRNAADNRLQELIRHHPELAQPNLRETLRHWLSVCGLVAVVLFDCVISAPTAEYLAGTYLGIQGVRVFASVIAFAVAVVLVELYFSVCRYSAREEGEASFWLWQGAAIVMLLIMSSLVAATQLASAEAPDRDGVFWLRCGALVLLALLLHGAVLFGGRYAHDGKAYVSFTLRRGRLNRQIALDGRAAEQSARRAGDGFGAYMAQMTAFNKTYPDARIDPAMFDRETQQVLEQHFGYPVIETRTPPPRGDDPAPEGGRPAAPNGSDGNGSHPTGWNAGTPTAADDGDGENEYLRSLLNRRIREDEAEVRP